MPHTAGWKEIVITWPSQFYFSPGNTNKHEQYTFRHARDCSEFQLVKSLQYIPFWTFGKRHINNLDLKWTKAKWCRIKSITNATEIFMETVFWLKDCIYRMIYALVSEISVDKRSQSWSWISQPCFSLGEDFMCLFINYYSDACGWSMAALYTIFK